MQMRYLVGVENIFCTGSEESLFDCLFTMEFESSTIDSLAYLDCSGEFMHVSCIKEAVVHHDTLVAHTHHHVQRGLCALNAGAHMTSYLMCCALQKRERFFACLRGIYM